MSLSEKEIREIITPLLLSGAKMLDKHCPRCGAPMFEMNGRVFCPVCEYRKKQEHGVDIEKSLEEKLKELASNLPNNLDELEKHLNVMEKIINLLEKYKKLKLEG
ncbi:Sjogren's syndrome/scleroderma autoantigen 1 family protein [Thermococcus sp.]